MTDEAIKQVRKINNNKLHDFEDVLNEFYGKKVIKLRVLCT